MSTHRRTRFNSLITVLAGEEEVQFVLHRQILCEKSEFFATAWKQYQEEGGEKRVFVPYIKPDAFELYVHWVYSDKVDLSLVPLASPRGENYRFDDRGSRIQNFQHLIELYVAGDEFENVTLQNMVIDELAAMADAWDDHDLRIQPDHIEYVWEETSPGDRLRTLILDNIAATQDPGSLICFKFKTAQAGHDFW
ncbi:hypothetical protein LTR48_002120 [Friedmanniomyces endolithicus]|uniref:BTB domain-containing protein n=2 Tax=Dothideomycetidae TaxID=451867 RepID=A0A4U0U914_9PEZI|nr:hypothetical protein LTS09_011246 [Friedmanniomyces endolithicus]KAK0927673.1 hypothetical protein LTR29_017594 [Friedmanniomyces endolithicus]KAK1093525.1 hypothetical protein LTR48_002120 [Friedmanniomyces endolithicus]KAK5146604.1 hypothetical protein LTR32_001819 [Rachicladosporium monterosium]TKA31162.1 hypothetical protein B0A54_14296 [Friedmanniomyces endolithicus]